MNWKMGFLPLNRAGKVYRGIHEIESLSYTGRRLEY